MALRLEYTIGYLEDIKARYGKNYPRRTEIEQIEKIDRTRAALNNIKVFWDRKNGHVGTNIKSEDVIMCNEFDKLLCVERSGIYHVYDIPDKMHVGKLYDFRKYDAKQEFGVIYSEKKTGKFYGKRSTIDKFIKEKEYNLCPDGCRLELFTPRADAIYDLEIEMKRGNNKHEELNLMTLPVRSPKARGFLIGANILKITHQRYLEESELAAFAGADDKAENTDLENNNENTENVIVDNKPAKENIAETVTGSSLEAMPEYIQSPEAAEAAEIEVPVVVDSEPGKTVKNNDNVPDDTEKAPMKQAAVEDNENTDSSGSIPTEDMAPVAESEAAEDAEKSEVSESVVVIEKNDNQISTHTADDIAVESSESDSQTDTLFGESVKTESHLRPARRTSKTPKTTGNNENSDNDLGIVQPELGF